MGKDLMKEFECSDPESKLKFRIKLREVDGLDSYYVYGWVKSTGEVLRWTHIDIELVSALLNKGREIEREERLREDVRSMVEHMKEHLYCEATVQDVSSCFKITEEKAQSILDEIARAKDA